MPIQEETLLYFGSFNPIHRGHLAVADSVIEATGVAALWFVVSPQNPFKSTEALAPEIHRIEMVRRAIPSARYAARMAASAVEFELPRPSRTIRTLETLELQYPTRTFSLLIGGDNVAEFTQWAEYEKILAHYRVWVYPRPGYPRPSMAWCQKLTYLEHVPLWPYEATHIREEIAAGGSPESLLPPEVWPYIRTHHLYGWTESEQGALCRNPK